MNKVDYFLSHPIQYISPLLGELAKEVDLNVYYYSDHGVNNYSIDKGFGMKIQWDIPLFEGYQYFFLKNISNSQKMNCNIFDAINPTIFNVLKKSKSHIVIVNGWSYLTDLLIIMTAGFFGKKVWLRVENPLHKELASSVIKRFLRRLILKYFLFLFVDRFLYIGSENKKYYKHFGVNKSKLIYTPYAVDNLKFKNQFYENKINVNEYKSKLNIPIDDKVILFCGKFIPVKRPLDVVKAFKSLDNDNCTLIMVGDGPMNTDIQEFIKNNNILNVVCPGFVNQSEIFKYYIMADIFVLCSEMETWGLAVNEALNFNVPCVVSDKCGCGFDLIKEGITGYIFEMGNVISLKKQLIRALAMPKIKANIEILDEFSISNIVTNLSESLNLLNTKKND